MMIRATISNQSERFYGEESFKVIPAKAGIQFDGYASCIAKKTSLLAQLSPE
jgi:hypothetical protein